MSGALVTLRNWIIANGGEVLSDEADAESLRFRSVRGIGSVTLGKGSATFTGDGRLAMVCATIGTTLEPFGLYPVLYGERVETPAARPAVKRATVISDASLDDRTGAGGWAAWMIADGRQSATYGGQIPVACASSTEAELIAIAKALQAAVNDDYAPDGAEVLIQSDSANALALVRRAVPDAIDLRHATHGIAIPAAQKVKHSAIVERFENEIRALVRKHRLTIHVRHVPGHTAGDGRQWVNRECDRIAKGHMRQARAARRPASLTLEQTP